MTDRPDGRAWLSALGLSRFRNYAALSLRPDSRPVVLTGRNGAGKTNLLEAISFLSPGRGLRRATLDEVAQRPGDGSWAVTASVEGAAPADIGTGLAPSPDGAPARQRSVRINRAPARSSEALLEHLRVIWLTPGMDGLFTGPAAERRRFLDRLVLAIDRRHGERVNAFDRATRGRNRILEGYGGDAAWLTATETQMAELGTAIAAARVECVRLLGALIADAAPEQPFPAARLDLPGTLETLLQDGARATEVEDRYRDLLAAGRSADRAAGRTLTGPHLSDLAVSHAGKGVPAATCSTGEQKALLIGIVLAHARLIARLTGETPLVLLDEVAAHLDAGRRAALFAILADLGCQAWMTGTEPEPFAALGDRAQYFEVEDGTVHRGG